MKNVKTKDLLKELESLKQRIDDLTPKMEQWRSFNKYQDEEKDEISESAILSWENVKEIVHVIDSLKELGD